MKIITAMLEAQRFDKALSRMREQFVTERKQPSAWFSDDQRVNIARSDIANLYNGGLPEIVGKISPETADQLLVAASLELAGYPKASRKFLPRKVNLDARLSTDVAVRMCVFAARHRSKIDRMQEADIRVVRIRGIGNGCAECAALDGRKFKLSSVPELPYAKCTCEGGCRCTVLADFEGSWWGKLLRRS